MAHQCLKAIINNTSTTELPPLPDGIDIVSHILDSRRKLELAVKYDDTVIAQADVQAWLDSVEAFQADRNKKTLTLYSCSNHSGVWLNGVSVIVAETFEEARHMLDDHLRENGLPTSETDNYALVIIPFEKGVYPLWDGDY